jgi:hypothetical protein
MLNKPGSQMGLFDQNDMRWQRLTYPQGDAIRMLCGLLSVFSWVHAIVGRKPQVALNAVRTLPGLKFVMAASQPVEILVLWI